VLVRLYSWLNVIGNVLIFIGGLGLVLGLSGLINLDTFAVGITAGVRIVGTLAIAGCLLNAISCFGLEFINETS